MQSKSFRHFICTPIIVERVTTLGFTDFFVAIIFRNFAELHYCLMISFCQRKQDTIRYLASFYFPTYFKQKCPQNVRILEHFGS